MIGLGSDEKECNSRNIVITAQSDIANRYSAKIDQPNLLIFGPYWLKTLFFNK